MGPGPSSCLSSFPAKVAERLDEKLPYIDQGYVDESQPDFMAEIGKLFGGDKKK